jgi:hypothetical protein
MSRIADENIGFKERIFSEAKKIRYSCQPEYPSPTQRETIIFKPSRELVLSLQSD